MFEKLMEQCKNSDIWVNVLSQWDKSNNLRSVKKFSFRAIRNSINVV